MFVIKWNLINAVNSHVVVFYFISQVCHGGIELSIQNSETKQSTQGIRSVDLSDSSIRGVG